MNIISNNCLGGFFYKNNNIQYTNPFIWSAILADSMYYLIKNWKNINFNNYIIEKSEFNNTQNKLDIFKLIIDNNIIAHYTHFHFNSTDNKPRIKGFDVFYNKIWEYVINKYENRLKRMNEEPIFIILGEYERNGTNMYDYTFEKEKKILDIKTNYKIILITKYKEFLEYNDLNHLIILDKTTRGKIINGINPNPEYFYEKHHKEILEFIEK